MRPQAQLSCIFMLLLLGAIAHPLDDLFANSTPTERSLPPIQLKGAKRGLSFHNTDYIQKWGGSGTQISWAYNWDSTMPASFPKILEYIPMLWSNEGSHTGQPSLEVPTTFSPSTNQTDAQMEVHAWRAYLGAPAVTNGLSGMKWLKEFLGLCTSCRIDFVPIHWYDSATNVAYFKNYIADAHEIAGHDLWITEFNGSGKSSEKESFLRTVIPWLDTQSYIQRYSWYWCDAKSTLGTIVDKKGNPTSLGKVYGYLAS
ncbi:glycosyl hydrolase catalytic core-domain-containing protein [Leptodontidium sp. 2 PMI_412]|nr:glycosyl hydrolase catalytic core-domain-containing protein [Leptodontidium sp. 2 PMI_412]